MEVSVGAQLKQARTELQLSLKDVTKDTKIQPWVLEALERDQLHATMSPVYVKSFLTTYAKHVRLDPAQLIAQLFPEPPAVVASAAETAPRQSWMATLADLAIPRLKPAILGLVAIGCLVMLKPQRWLAPLTHRQEASFWSMTRKTDTPRPELALNLKPTQLIELAVIAHRPTWVSVKADGKALAQQQLLYAKSEWTAQRRLELVIGSPSKVDVLINGRSITPLALSHHGRLLITRNGVKSLDAHPGKITRANATPAPSPTDAPTASQ